MNLFIKKIFSISPQEIINNSFITENDFEIHPRLSSILKVIDPDYNQLISLNEQRRMCKLVKMGVYSARWCLDSKNETPLDAIIIGNGLGIFERASVFLEALVMNDERGLPPTPFIQSLHSAIAGQIALEFKFTGYTTTYTQNAFSFENCIMDASLLAKESAFEHMLIGALDEIPNTYIKTFEDLGRIKKQNEQITPLEKSKSPGICLGEGSVFMMLSSVSDSETLASITGFKQIYKPQTATEISTKILELLAEQNITPQEIDLILLGNCGDLLLDHKINEVQTQLFMANDKIFFKNYCGEYPTASSFAVWLGTAWLNNPNLRSRISGTTNNNNSLKALILNHYNDVYYSVILLNAKP